MDKPKNRSRFSPLDQAQESIGDAQVLLQLSTAVQNTVSSAITRDSLERIGCKGDCWIGERCVYKASWLSRDFSYLCEDIKLDAGPIFFFILTLFFLCDFL